MSKPNPPRRFTIRRAAVAEAMRSPWALRDVARPAYVGQFTTHERAILAMSNQLRAEAGLPPRLSITVPEILAAMGKRA